MLVIVFVSACVCITNERVSVCQWVQCIFNWMSLWAGTCPCVWAGEQNRRQQRSRLVTMLLSCAHSYFVLCNVKHPPFYMICSLYLCSSTLGWRWFSGATTITPSCKGYSVKCQNSANSLTTINWYQYKERMYQKIFRPFLRNAEICLLVLVCLGEGFLLPRMTATAYS